MNILTNVSLKLYSTMRLGGKASFVTEIKTRKDLLEAEKWIEERDTSLRLIGGGSNTIWRDEGFDGLLCINKIKGFRLLEETKTHATYKIGSGENWDNTVSRLVKLGLSGVECLSLIPGTVGATPIQNVGAYGQEISETLVSLEAYDRVSGEFVVIKNSDCNFGYRTSRFKTIDNGRFLICSVTLRLKKVEFPKIKYEAVSKYLTEKGIAKPTIADIRQAVINIRINKLPDPMNHPNSGSFFSNPIVDEKTYLSILKKHKDIKSWLTDNKYKLSAAQLIEKAGFKDKIDPETGMTTWKNQPLVVVNYKARHTEDLITYQTKVTNKIFDMFGVTLEREPEILPY